MYKAKVNNEQALNIELDGKHIRVDGQLVALDAVELGQGHSHIIHQDQSYRVELESLDSGEKSAIVKVNGNVYRVDIADQYDLLLAQLGMDSLSARQVTDVRAPMPGLVLDILVVPGQQVKKGDNLVVLEAMKMENMLKSAVDGEVKAVPIQKGDKVEKNSILVQFKG